MSTKLYLIRHGETEWNCLGKYQGSSDMNLSKRGILQARYLHKRLHGKYDCIYTSPMKRAFQTAEIIAGDEKDKLKIENDLREIDYGEWEGLTADEILKKYPDEYNKWKTDKIKAPLCGGDLSLKNASIRAKNAILKIARSNPLKKVLVVAHGGIIRAGLIGIFEFDMSLYHKIVLANTAISEVDFDNNLRPIIVSLNDTKHLPDELIEEFNYLKEFE